MQESGVPNVSGGANLNCNGYASGGVLSNKSATWGNSGGGSTGGNELEFYLSRGSNQYQNISEVRVKSIISNGYIRLY